MLSNALRSLAAEFGLVVAQGLGRLNELVALVEVEADVPEAAREATRTLYEQFRAVRDAAAGLGATVMTGLMRRMNPSLDLAVLHMREPLTRQIVLISRGDVAQRQPVRVFVDEARSLVDELLPQLHW